MYRLYNKLDFRNYLYSYIFGYIIKNVNYYSHFYLILLFTIYLLIYNRYYIVT